MGNFGFFLFSDQITQLEEFKKMLKDPAEIADVDKTIALLRSKMAEKM